MAEFTDEEWDNQIEIVKQRSAAYVASGLCGATDGGYGACQLELGHEGRFHNEHLKGAVWAQWSGDDRD